MDLFYFLLCFFLIFLFESVMAIDCVLEYYFNQTEIPKTTCTDADICFHFHAEVGDFVRRGCIQGYKYFPTKFGCYYDPDFTTKSSVPVTDPSGTMCFCNTTNCNSETPIVKKKGSTVTITLDKQELPVIIRPIIDCYNYSNWNDPTGFPFDPDNPSVTWSGLEGSPITRGPVCASQIVISDVDDDGLLDQTRWSGSSAMPGWSQQFFRIQEGQADWPPYYPGLVTRYDPFYNRFSIDYSCETDRCNGISDLTYLIQGNLICWQTDGSTCDGDLCFISWTKMKSMKEEFRGCLRQDYTRAVGRIEVGEMVFTANHIFCAEDFCNWDRKSTRDSAKDFIPKWPQFTPAERPDPPIPTTTPSSESLETTTNPSNPPFKSFSPYISSILIAISFS